MDNGTRWELALQAHAAEHEAMRDRGLARVAVLGRQPGMGQPMAARAYVPRMVGGQLKERAGVVPPLEKRMRPERFRFSLKGLGAANNEAWPWAVAIVGGGLALAVFLWWAARKKK